MKTFHFMKSVFFWVEHQQVLEAAGSLCFSRRRPSAAPVSCLVLKRSTLRKLICGGSEAASRWPCDSCHHTETANHHRVDGLKFCFQEIEEHFQGGRTLPPKFVQANFAKKLQNLSPNPKIRSQAVSKQLLSAEMIFGKFCQHNDAWKRATCPLTHCATHSL